jgi:5-methylcytosine-specific restriction endonuclease McrA
MATENIPQDRPIVTIEQARKLGLARYFTGKPCKNGHVCERSTDRRLCLECYRQKQRAKYHKNIDQKRAELRRRYARDIKKRRRWAKLYYQNNKQDRLAYARRRYAENKERIDRENKEYAKRNPDRRRAIARKWARNNPETLKKWCDGNPEKRRIYASLNQSRRRTRIKERGKFTKADIDHILKSQNGRCAYCRSSIKDDYHIDHIKPLAKGGSNWPANIQLCCADCNHSKNARDPLEFAREIGFLL